MANDSTPTLAGTIAMTTSSPPAAAPSQARLRITHLGGSLSGRTQDLQPGTISIGRHPESQIRYDHTVDFLVSTRHGQLTFENGHWWFSDNGSTNGSYVNGAKVQRQLLSNGTVITLGIPNAPGGAAFRVDLDGAAPAADTDGTLLAVDAPFAQEPPGSDEVISFNCARCGSPNTASQEQAGEMALCKACGKPTRVPPTGIRPPGAAMSGPPPALGQPPVAPPAAVPFPPVPGPQAHVAPAAPPSVAPPPISAPPIATHPVSAQPAAKVPEGGFFGGIIGGIKSNINRRRERKDLQRELAELEQQIPQMETDLRQACMGLGKELWRTGKDQLSGFRASPRLAEMDSAVAELETKQSAIDREFGERTTEYQEWLAGWQDQAAKLDEALKDATQARADAEASVARAKEAVVAALASRAEDLTAAAQRATELAAEAKTEPQDDFWQRYQAMVDETAAKIEQLRSPVPELPDLIAARTTARETLAVATARHEDAAANVQTTRKERESKDAAYADVQRVYQQAQAAHRGQVDKVQAQAPPQHADLGRQYVEAKDAPQITPAPPQLTTARGALERLTQARASIAHKRQRLSELEAG